MDGWMDNEKRMMVEGERELRRVSMTRLGCLVALPKLGRVFKVRSKTRHSLQSPNFCEPAQATHKVSLRFWSPSLYSVTGRRNRALKRSTTVTIAMLKLILPRSALMNAESREGTTSMSYQSRSVYIRQSFDDAPVLRQAYHGVCGYHLD